MTDRNRDEMLKEWHDHARQEFERVERMAQQDLKWTTTKEMVICALIGIPIGALCGWAWAIWL